MVPTCSSGTLTNMLTHRNAMPQTQDMTPHPVAVYRNGADFYVTHKKRVFLETGSKSFVYSYPCSDPYFK